MGKLIFSGLAFCSGVVLIFLIVEWIRFSRQERKNKETKQKDQK